MPVSLSFRRWLLPALAFALVAAQALGLMHRVVHGPQAAWAAAHGDGLAAGVDGHGHDHHHHHGEHDHDDGGQAFVGAVGGHDAAHAQDHLHGHGHGWIAALFAGHADDTGCRLFDPLNHEGLAALPVLAVPLVFSSFFLDVFQGECLARWAALFDARGPPVLR